MNPPPKIPKKILVAVDESNSSKRALVYVAEMIGGRKDINVLVLHIINEPEEDFFPKAGERQKWLSAEKEKTDSMLSGYRALLIENGVDPECIAVLSKVRSCPSIGDCILNEMESSASRTVVVGRKGVSKKEELLFGSVSNRIIHHAKDCTIWVVA
jgi:nucleotide-binding universal stress UspA family protein